MTKSRVTQLERVEFEVSDLDAWERFGTEVLGLEAIAPTVDGSLKLRMDENHHRISLTPGPRDDIVHAGWQVDDAAALATVSAQLSQQDAPVHQASPDEAASLGVGGLIRTVDPDGLVHEISWGCRPGVHPFVPPDGRDGFVAGDLGLGHIVLAARDMGASLRFFADGLGLLVSDHIDIDMGDDGTARVTFLHCGPRHHSLALAPFPQAKHLHHLMLQVQNPDDVGTTLDLCHDAGIPIASSLGRHTNDRMTSFYAVTPSGFQVEYGHGGVEIDDASWEVRTYDAASTWGHRAPVATS
jgi:2,3-dihydroxybiphenyl 1,2-dioxygenase